MDPHRDIPGIVRRRRYPRKDTDRRYRRTNYVAMQTTVTLADVIAWARQNTGVAPEEVTLHFSTMRWEDDATVEEIAAWEKEERDRAARAEAWERERLAELFTKYGPPA